MPSLDPAAFRPTTYSRYAAGDTQPPPRLLPHTCSDATPSATVLRRVIHTSRFAHRPDITKGIIPLPKQESNAAHHPPAHAGLMRGTLLRVGCMPLLGCAHSED